MESQIIFTTEWAISFSDQGPKTQLTSKIYIHIYPIHIHYPYKHIHYPYKHTHHPYTYIHYPLSFGFLGARHRQAPARLATSAHHPHTSRDGHYSLWPLLKHVEEWILRADKAPFRRGPIFVFCHEPTLGSDPIIQTWKSSAERKMSSYVSLRVKEKCPQARFFTHSRIINELLQSYSLSQLLCCLY